MALHLTAKPMRSLVLIALACLIGCSGSKPDPERPNQPNPDGDSSIKSVVESYVNAPLAERHKYILNGPQLKDQMADYYAQVSSTAKVELVNVDGITRPNKAAAIARATVLGSLGSEQATRTHTYYLRKPAEAWLVDWPATVGWNDIPIKTFRATAPTERTTFRVLAELDDYYNLQYLDAQKSHLSVGLSDRTGTFHGYARKDSETGRKILQLLQDGGKHELAVAVQCDGKEGSVVEIVELIGDNWFID